MYAQWDGDGDDDEENKRIGKRIDGALVNADDFNNTVHRRRSHNICKMKKKMKPGMKKGKRKKEEKQQVFFLFVTQLGANSSRVCLPKGLIFPPMMRSLKKSTKTLFN